MLFYLIKSPAVIMLVCLSFCPLGCEMLEACKDFITFNQCSLVYEEGSCYCCCVRLVLCLDKALLSIVSRKRALFSRKWWWKLLLILATLLGHCQAGLLFLFLFYIRFFCLFVGTGAFRVKATCCYIVAVKFV